MAEDSPTVPVDQEERARFAKEKRWSLLTALAWIATRDMDSAFRASRRAEDIDGANISIAVSMAWAGMKAAHKTVGDAWAQEMAPAVSEGRIGGSGSIVTAGVLNGVERREVGHTFPSPMKPREADHLEPMQRGDEIALSPIGSRYAHAWTEWRDLLFSTDDIMNLWPMRDPTTQDSHLAAIASLLAEKTPNAERYEPSINSPAVELAIQAIQAVFPGAQIPKELSAKERDNRIFRWCDDQGHRKPSPRSINRAIQRLRHRHV